MKNKYCDQADLRNEADVEQNFVRRFLEDLGYSDKEILPKQSLNALTIGGMRGQPQQLYTPDFGLRVNRQIRWIVEAKEPGEKKLERHQWQPRAYTVLLNGTKKGKTVRYYVLTNGHKTRIYDPDLNDPLLELDFADFSDANKKFQQFGDWLARNRILADIPGQKPETLKLEKRPLSDVNAAFSWCHQHIYRKDDISQSEAFTEFVKLISLKLMSDRTIRDRHQEILTSDAIEVPIDEVDFCLYWIERNERNTHNPVSDILFRNFMRDMEIQISNERRKRIFDPGEEIRLKPETIRGVVKRLENIFLFGIDADLNGRLFETFLNATMRGKDLGQFFTPRSLIKLGVGLCDLKVRVPIEGKLHTDTVIDACCGTGGFLIDALADMWRKVDQRSNLSSTERGDLKGEIANTQIVGIDVANAPKLARIARLNMYLHGDGGTRVFHLSALDKELKIYPTDSPDIQRERNELRRVIENGGFDIALTNPPFAKLVDRTTEDEKRILDGYDIGRENGIPRSSIRSCLLFAERYYDLLRPGGRLVTIIDDGILSGDDHRWFRNQLREWFLIRAVISLPGDAFQRSNARVKTSFLIAEKRHPTRSQAQPPVFMFPCQYVGIDDQKRQRAQAGDSDARDLAEQEIKEVIREYRGFMNGESSYYGVAPERVMDRLDVKNCLMTTGRSVAMWCDKGFRVLSLSDALKPRIYSDDEIIGKDHPEMVRVLIVRYEGIAEGGGEVLPAEGSYSRWFPTHAGDIIISNIAANYGSIAVVPDDLAGCVVSNEYTILTPLDDFDPVVLQLILRSPEVRSDILLSASGANRTRTRWEYLQNIKIPYPSDGMVKQIRALADEAETAKKRALLVLENAREQVESRLFLRSETASTILSAFKPPQ